MGNQESVAKFDCLSCAIERDEVDISQGRIITTQFFDAHQDFEIPISGFIIVSSRQHMQAIDEFPAEMLSEFSQLIAILRRGLRETAQIDTMYLFQNEGTRHHFHQWLFPRYTWMDQFGQGLTSIKPIFEYARHELATEDNLQEVVQIVQQLRKFLAEQGYQSQKPLY